MSRERLIEEKDQLIAQIAQLRKKLEQYERKEESQHVWGRSNPLKFPPNCYTRDVAKVNQPFLAFRMNTRRPTCALVKRRMMASVVRHAYHKALAQRIQDAESTYKTAREEMELRPWHLSLLEGMTLLTTPSGEAISEMERLERDLELLKEKDVLTDDDEDEESPANEESDEEFDPKDFDPKDLSLHVGAGEKEAKVPVLREGEQDDTQEVGDNATTVLGASADETSRNDIAVKVLDVRASQWVVVLVVECKVPLTKDAIYQALCYAFKRGMENVLEANRVAPVHVMAWSDKSWTYGVIDIYGVIHLQNGGIAPESYADLVRHQKTRSMYMKKPDSSESKRFTQKKLEWMLNSRKQMLQRSCSLFPDLEYPDGYYLVGDVYVNSQEKKLPRGSDVVMLGDTLLFYETLMRVIVGNRVVSWTTEDIDKAVLEREEIRKRKKQVVDPARKRQRT